MIAHHDAAVRRPKTLTSGGVGQAAITLALAALTVVWVGGSGYRQDLVILTSTYALLALGMYVPFIMGDRLSLAYNAYLGIGAYAVGIIATRTEWSLLLAFPIAMVLSALLAIALGFVTRQLSGFFLAAVTLLFGLAFETWLIDSTGITGGGAGIGGIRQLSLFGTPLSRSTLVIVTILIVWGVAMTLARLRRSAFGIAVRVQREVAVAVEATGIRVPVLTLASLALGAAIASVGGSMFAVVNRSILPESFTLTIVFLAIFMPLLGGQRSPWGAVLGAVLVTYFTFSLQFFAGTGTLLFALAVLLVLLIAPQGVLGLLGDSYRRLAPDRTRSVEPIGSEERT